MRSLRTCADELERIEHTTLAKVGPLRRTIGELRRANRDRTAPDADVYAKLPMLIGGLAAADRAELNSPADEPAGEHR